MQIIFCYSHCLYIKAAINVSIKDVTIEGAFLKSRYRKVYFLRSLTYQKVDCYHLKTAIQNVPQDSFSYKICKIHRKTLAMASFLNKEITQVFSYSFMKYFSTALFIGDSRVTAVIIFSAKRTISLMECFNQLSAKFTICT